MGFIVAPESSRLAPSVILGLSDVSDSGLRIVLSLAAQKDLIGSTGALVNPKLADYAQLVTLNGSSAPPVTNGHDVVTFANTKDGQASLSPLGE